MDATPAAGEALANFFERAGEAVPEAMTPADAHDEARTRLLRRAYETGGYRPTERDITAEAHKILAKQRAEQAAPQPPGQAQNEATLTAR